MKVAETAGAAGSRSIFRSHGALPCAAIALCIAAMPGKTHAGLEWGVFVPDDRNSQWSFSYGSVASLSGSIDETFRAYYEATGQNSKQALAESWKLKDFGFDAPWTSYGLHYEHYWHYVSFRFDLALFELDASATARRDYYIGLEDDVSYGGRSFDHMKIPAGSKFSSEFSGGMGSALFAITPFSIALGTGVTLIPELDLGLLGAGGKWKIDAGRARGTAVYQNPPVDFVVGGSSSAFIGAGAPFAGLGLELRVGADDYVQWVTRASTGFFSYSGSTKPFTSSSHREKDLDIDLFSVSLDTSVILPMDENTCFIVGGRAQWLSIDGSIKSKERDTAAIVAARERFDKKADIDILMLQLYAGITF
ncbi:MAG: hypothetical protein IJS46_06330 [Kiritimatiellae bacterium]|nr:hypothetical protein [Kiritimatiellia bacterium]